MKWIIAAFLLLLPASAFAQCNGIFPPNTVCGNSTGSPAFPTAIAPTAGGVAGPGTSVVGDFATWNNTSGTLLADTSPTAATAVLNVFSSSLKGLAPASGGGTTNFLRADGSWAAPAGGGTPASPTGSVQYNNASAFGAFGFWDGSATLSLGNSTTAQGFRVYNTVDTLSGPTNYERLTIDWTTLANTATIATQAGGTGSNRNLNIKGAGGLNLNTGGGGQIVIVPGGTGDNFTFFPGSPSAFGLQSDAILQWYSGAGHSPSLQQTSAAAPVMLIGDGSGASHNTSGWINWGGEARLDADFSATSNTTLANVTGSSHSLTVTLVAGENYIFEISLPMVTGATAGGIKIALGGTATVTNLIADGICMDGPTAALISTTRVSTLATAIVATTNAGTTPKCTLSGTFEVLAAGTFTVQFAQNASSGTASTVKRGAYMMVNDAP